MRSYSTINELKTRIACRSGLLGGRRVGRDTRYSMFRVSAARELLPLIHIFFGYRRYDTCRHARENFLLRTQVVDMQMRPCQIPGTSVSRACSNLARRFLRLIYSALARTAGHSPTATSTSLFTSMKLSLKRAHSGIGHNSSQRSWPASTATTSIS